MKLCSDCKKKDLRIGRLCVDCQKQLVRERFDEQKNTPIKFRQPISAETKRQDPKT